MLDQGRACRRRTSCDAALRRLEAPPRRRQVRRVRRDRHRQPGEDRHPVDRDPLLARRRDRPAEPVGAHARQHAASTRCCCSAGPTRTCRSSRSAGASASRETWDERGYDYPKDVPIEELDLRAGERAVLRGVRRGASTACTRRPTSGVYTGIDGLDRVHHQRPQGAPRRDAPGPPLVAARATSSTTFRELYTIPKFDAGDVRARRRSCAASSASTAARPRRRPCSSTRTANILMQGVPALEGQPDPGHQGAPRAAQGVRRRARARRSRCMGFGATGYAADVLEESRASRREHRRDRRAHDERRAVLRRRRRHLRHRRAGHQGPVHEERRHRELPPVEPVLGRQRHAAPGDGRSVRRARSPSTPTPRSRPSSRRSSATAAPSSSTPTA